MIRDLWGDLRGSVLSMMGRVYGVSCGVVGYMTEGLLG